MDLPKLTLQKADRNDMCFGCGKDNPVGLHLKFYEEGDTVKAEFVPNENHQSWPGYVHGGVLSVILDEAIGKACFREKAYCVTAQLDICIKSMARIGEPLIASGHITRRSKRLFETEAELRRKDGTIVAEASSLQFVVNTIS